MTDPGFVIEISWLILVSFLGPLAVFFAWHHRDNSWAGKMDSKLKFVMLQKNSAFGLPGTRVLFILIVSLCLVQPSTGKLVIERPCTALALDLTSSMSTILPSGLTKIQQSKLLLEQWILDHPDNALSLWVWAHDSFQIVPRTTDYSFILNSLKNLQTDFMDSTQINAVQSIRRIDQQFPIECSAKQILITSDGIPVTQLAQLKHLENLSVIDVSPNGSLTDQLRENDIRFESVADSAKISLTSQRAEYSDIKSLHPAIKHLLLLLVGLWLILSVDSHKLGLLDRLRMLTFTKILTQISTLTSTRQSSKQK